VCFNKSLITIGGCGIFVQNNLTKKKKYDKNNEKIEKI